MTDLSSFCENSDHTRNYIELVEMKMPLKDPLASTFKRLPWGGVAGTLFHNHMATLIEQFHGVNRLLESQFG